jgi:sortase A
MPDRRSVDELSIEELEEILAIRKREARLARLQRLHEDGRVVDVPAPREPARLAGPDRDTRSTPRSYYHVNELEAEQARRRLSFRPRRSTVKTWRDRLLLLVEIGAVASLIFVVLSLEQARLETNQVVALSPTLPPPEPTPLIAAVVLPSGHRPPTSPGGAAPNFDEVPAHLRAFVQAVTPQPIATPGPGQPTRLQIPAINVDAQIVQGDSWEQLKKGVGQHLGTANPGERGNLVLSAHNDIFGEIFRHLDQLKAGDEIIVSAGSQRYRYVVHQRRVIAPTQVDVLQPTHDPTVTLISCYPYLVDNQRIVVSAELE